jgi:hypothetical protein
MYSSNDLNQRWVMDLGLPGPDAGRGGKHVFLPPGYAGEVPEGYFAGRSTTSRVLVMLRALPAGGDADAAVAMMKTVKVYPLGGSPADWPESSWVPLSEPGTDLTPLRWETSLAYWEQLHGLINSEPAYEGYRNYYGKLAAFGIIKGEPFAPDQRMTAILENAARIGNAQMRVQAFADRRPDRLAWPGRNWEWATLHPENGTFDADNYVDLTARGIPGPRQHPYDHEGAPCTDSRYHRHCRGCWRGVLSRASDLMAGAGGARSAAVLSRTSSRR